MPRSFSMECHLRSAVHVLRLQRFEVNFRV
jgi:hypothetical protein